MATGVGTDADVLVRPVTLAAASNMLTAFAATEDGTEWFVGERTGVVHRMTREQVGGYTVPVVDPDPVLDLTGEVSLSGEQGLFDLAMVDGDSKIAVSYTGADGALTVDLYDRPSAGPFDMSTRRSLVALPWMYPWHHGGSLELDGDGDLLLGVGDQGLSLPVTPAPQDPEMMIGGILSIPSAALSGHLPDWRPTPAAMVARGLRNPWRLSVDPVGGDVWVGDVGNESVEEVDRIDGGELGGEVVNFGWPFYEGGIQNYSAVPADLVHRRAVLEHRQQGDVCGVVGGHVYRGRMIPALEGRYIYSDLCNGEIRSFRPGAGGSAQDDRVVGEWPEPVISIGVDARGELYGLGSGGGLHRLDPPQWRPPASTQRLTAMPVAPTPHDDRTERVDCGVIQSLAPFTHLAAMAPEELRLRMAELISELTRLVPELPAHLRPSGDVVLGAFRDLAGNLEAAGWDLGSPELAELREEMVGATGSFEGFPRAMAEFFASECE